MKNKLGTRQLPTAELLLDGTEARLVRYTGGEGGGGVDGDVRVGRVEMMVRMEMMVRVEVMVGWR